MAHEKSGYILSWFMILMIPFVILSWWCMMIIWWLIMFSFRTNAKFRNSPWKEWSVLHGLRIGHFQNQWTWRTTMSWRCSSECPGSQDPQDLCLDSGDSLPYSPWIIPMFTCPKVWGENFVSATLSTAHSIAPSHLPNIIPTPKRIENLQGNQQLEDHGRSVKRKREKKKKHLVEAASSSPFPACWLLSHIIDRYWPSLTARSDVSLMDHPNHLRSSPARVHQLSGSSSPAPISTKSKWHELRRG